MPQWAGDVTAFMGTPWGALAIFALRIVDVSCDTMRILFAVRGKRLVAGVLGFVQVLVWLFAVGSALQHLNSWLHVLGYAAGYATGTMVGITIEQAVAYGLAVVRITSPHGGVEIAEALRDRGYGVTELSGHGREGTVEIVDCVVHRSHLSDVMEIVDRWDTGAFVTVSDPRVLRGGSFATREWPIVGRRRAR